MQRSFMNDDLMDDLMMMPKPKEILSLNGCIFDEQPTPLAIRPHESVRQA
jgi:hypothetical protein